jgi:hypothetical protein
MIQFNIHLIFSIFFYIPFYTYYKLIIVPIADQDFAVLLVAIVFIIIAILSERFFRDSSLGKFTLGVLLFVGVYLLLIWLILRSYFYVSLFFLIFVPLIVVGIWKKYKSEIS